MFYKDSFILHQGFHSFKSSGVGLDVLGQPPGEMISPGHTVVGHWAIALVRGSWEKIAVRKKASGAAVSVKFLFLLCNSLTLYCRLGGKQTACVGQEEQK